jgi:D-glycero-D-manno-heptose 1,7-bisphosphate phosphatase
MARAVFLDRDGVINCKAPEGKYITQWDEVRFLPGVAKAVRCIREAGLLAVLVTNQRAVAKGLISEIQLHSLHARMWQELFGEGQGFDAVYYCPHQSEPLCGCRKPQPGMLLAAARDHGIDLRTSWMVGDSESDVVIGQRVGCRTIRIGSPELRYSTAADEVSASLLDAADRIISQISVERSLQYN